MTDDARREVFEALLEEAERARAFPEVHAFRMRFEGQREAIDALVREEAIRGETTYVPTLQGLRAYDSPLATVMLRCGADLLAALQDIYRNEPGPTCQPTRCWRSTRASICGPCNVG
jgi:hypothetical protein